MEITISKSDRKNKKFKAIVEGNDRKKTVHFGQAGASDMTQHGDEKRKDIIYDDDEYVSADNNIPYKFLQEKYLEYEASAGHHTPLRVPYASMFTATELEYRKWYCC